MAIEYLGLSQINGPLAMRKSLAVSSSFTRTRLLSRCLKEMTECP